MSTSHDFSNNYVVLVPQGLSFYDLFKMLWSNEIDQMGFVHSQKDREDYLQNRLMVVLFSLLFQKLLLLFSKLLAKLGSMVEFCLNLVSSNGGLLMLQGKMEIPKAESEKFMSFIGQIDRRVELDSSIKSGDYRYFSSLTVMASKLSYENHAFVKVTVQDHWKMELIGFYQFWNDFQEHHTTNAFILRDKISNPNIIVVVFRGTKFFDANAWCTDVDLSWYEFEEMGAIHGGFIKSLGLQRKTGWPKDVKTDPDRPVAYYFIREKLKELLRLNRRAKFIITGHSLGGALAALFPAVLALHEETWLLNRLHGIYTYGQPRVGNDKFKDFMEKVLHKHGCRYFRFVYSNDIVTRLPTNNPNFMFQHFGTCLYFNSCYKGKEVEEEAVKNYFSFGGLIQHSFVALWELIRSFLIPYIEGPEYTETWLLKAIRLISVVFPFIFPGLVAHNMQDYVNLTRLGCQSLFINLQDNVIVESYYSSDEDSCYDIELEHEEAIF
ncbi:uncharacterized protein LOC101210786 isoform X1 [Cucumis sativus]|uniref:Fungal lipase-type domain-containing protein n=1 Tax=Cucumis sativus TaxID=3659 RepID=A0A0A0LPZ0_CUCSA|nr:uncharacterized protein LOC101210786 isoform X1 [Cucumis sativus]KGN62006.1 hypothetical protein Csa_006630 [Cucumis sativus]